MQNLASRSFKFAIWVTIALLTLAASAALAILIRQPPADQLTLLAFVLEMFKVILAGFVVTVLGILIPAVSTETRERFQQRKESRIAYSKAKTANDYLKLRLASASYQEASTILQEAHFLKHQAELFDDFPEWLGRRFTYIDWKAKGADSLAKWWDNTMYERLSRTRDLLEANAEQWPNLTAAARIEMLRNVLPPVL